MKAWDASKMLVVEVSFVVGERNRRLVALAMMAALISHIARLVLVDSHFGGWCPSTGSSLLANGRF